MMRGYAVPEGGVINGVMVPGYAILELYTPLHYYTIPESGVMV